MGRAKQILAEFGAQLGRVLLALLLQFGVPIVALYLALVVPPLFGCLSYSDRPGPGCYGLSSRVGLAEAGRVDADVAAVAVIDLSTPDSALFTSSVAEAVGVMAGGTRTPAGLVLAAG